MVETVCQRLEEESARRAEDIITKRHERMLGERQDVERSNRGQCVEVRNLVADGPRIGRREGEESLTLFGREAKVSREVRSPVDRPARSRRSSEGDGMSHQGEENRPESIGLKAGGAADQRG